MIKKFDKNGAAALYRREFGESIEDGDYEKAFDILLKFSEQVDNPDFHMACGMLYLLMVQDSDDNEFLTLAFREFMIYLVERPDCRAAYRNILATVLMRRELRPLLEWSDFVKNKGFDLEEMLTELSEAGIDVFTGETEYLDIESIFKPGEFGLIDPARGKNTDASLRDIATESKGADDEKRESNIIRFRGGFDKAALDNGKKSAPAETLKFDPSSETADPDLDPLEFITQTLKSIDGEQIAAERDGDGFSVDIDLNDSSPARRNEVRARIALVEAENACARGKYDAALRSLDKLSKKDGHLYYCGECVRAFIMLDGNDLTAAQKALDRAFEIEPHGALAGTLQCRVYELCGKTAAIPDVLNNIDVADFIDSDHVYKAMRLAMKYCSEENALDLAEDYIDEYNIMDIRMLYAQMLYNYGDKEDAIDELYILSRIFYDDFNVMFYYLMAKADTPRMPLTEDAPQEFLGVMVDNVIDYLNSGVENMDSDTLAVGLEMFLTLEFDNDKKTTLNMFDALKRLAHMPKHCEKVNEALVSPYVEPIVKAVLLAEKLESGEREFFAEVGFCPIDGKFIARPRREYAKGFYTAYAFIATLNTDGLPTLLSVAEAVNDRAVANGISPQAYAYYLIRKARGNKPLCDKSTDRRVDIALGYKSKTAAAAEFKNTSTALDE